jgi:hypothetical protein
MGGNYKAFGGGGTMIPLGLGGVPIEAQMQRASWSCRQPRKENGPNYRIAREQLSKRITREGSVIYAWSLHLQLDLHAPLEGVSPVAPSGFYGLVQDGHLSCRSIEFRRGPCKNLVRSTIGPGPLQ